MHLQYLTLGAPSSSTKLSSFFPLVFPSGDLICKPNINIRTNNLNYNKNTIIDEIKKLKKSINYQYDFVKFTTSYCPPYLWNTTYIPCHWYVNSDNLKSHKSHIFTFSHIKYKFLNWCERIYIYVCKYVCMCIYMYI